MQISEKTEMYRKDIIKQSLKSKYILKLYYKYQNFAPSWQNRGNNCSGTPFPTSNFPLRILTYLWAPSPFEKKISQELVGFFSLYECRFETNIFCNKKYMHYSKITEYW